MVVYAGSPCVRWSLFVAILATWSFPETTVTESEADAYKQFVTEYSQYWRTFFDPIAVRVQATPERYRLETIVLPLINNSMYQSMAMALSGEPQQLSGNVTSDASVESASEWNLADVSSRPLFYLSLI